MCAMPDTDVLNLYLPPSDFATRYASEYLVPNLHLAKVVPFRKVASGTWVPKQYCCHDNVHRWTKLDQDALQVLGWLVIDHRSTMGFVRFMMHSVAVSIATDEHYDITPTDAEGKYPFLPGGLDGDKYFEFEKQLIDVYGVSRFDVLVRCGQ